MPPSEKVPSNQRRLAVSWSESEPSPMKSRRRDLPLYSEEGKVGLLTGLASPAAEHGVDAAGVFLLGGKGFGSGGGGGGLGGHDATLFLFDVDGRHKFDSFQCSVFREEEEVPSEQ